MKTDNEIQDREAQLRQSEDASAGLFFVLPNTCTGNDVFAALGFPTRANDNDSSEACSCYGPWASDLCAAIRAIEHPTMIVGPHGEFVRGQRDQLIEALRAALRETSERHLTYIKKVAV